ncbi:adenosylcobinamide-GDP ribazoletransferase [Paenibacillus filicis]|uniref:Adenosylcobinamide-GDP ribazoletransferase n=1 Tax=Paenibacillus gyeongsangnamensis TaxID=3388067 RepID=A0ABT4QHU1_9BACL|nr:adenosylcobinamide-GDP ribazoletransferase [Paenibacillus filicis]MCZ8516388.1 adenosylcobinamide-GDP ribazoletransferase [Paenibacillus filicis]
MRAFRLAIGEWTAAALAAFQFLTRLPVPVRLNYTDALFRRSVVFYPLAGLVLGLLLALAGWLLRMGLPTLPAAALLLTLWVGLTGALHLDGWMDTADGVLSHRSRERMLEIMKDSRVGAMGVMACVLLLLLKWSLLSELLQGDGHLGPSALPMILIPLWSRWYMVIAIACWPYARAEGSGGLGGYFRGVGRKHLAAVTALALLLSTAVLAVIGQGWMMLGMLAGGALVTGAAGSLYLSRKLGGLTGDTYGALNELIETVLLLALVLAQPMLGGG